MKVLDDRKFLVGFAVLVLFTGLAADAWRNSISWYGYGALVAAITGTSIAVLVRHRHSIRTRALPRPLLAFLALASISITWSFYPAESAVGVSAQLITTVAALAVALVLRADELLRALARALRIILSLSLAFELVVALLVRAPVLPVWVTEEDRVDPPLLLFWSRNLLLEGDRIQGVVGSSSLLAMVALLALVVFGVQSAAGAVGRAPGVLWLMFAGAMVALTRSATIYVAIAAVVTVLAIILVMRRASTLRARVSTYTAVALTVVAIIVAATLFRGQALALLGKSEDLTGRLGIWEAVLGLVQQRPLFGWGWISFWAPWVDPFRDLVTRNGVVQLHAHNAWLDVWLQLGLVGLFVLAALIAVTAVRSWRLATTSGRLHPSSPDSATSLLAPLLLTALLVQSFAESRLLIEGGWVLLVILAVTAKVATSDRRSAAGPIRRAREPSAP
ncbi:MAG: exopolysaccharide production protein [Microbacteriaceae bacterium]|jgi:O-antigen ligase|nr:exopolysaccharide production protein [Microbacteriaceae bacterium]HEV7956900.1 O-antigen ligase family protein [Marisediminicola sp.]